MTQYVGSRAVDAGVVRRGDVSTGRDAPRVAEKTVRETRVAAPGVAPTPSRMPINDRAVPSPVHTTLPAGRTTAGDSVDLSSAARSKAAERSASTGPVIRTEMVSRVREAIQAGDYLTPERLDLAVERLVGDYLSWL